MRHIRIGPANDRNRTGHSRNILKPRLHPAFDLPQYPMQGRASHFTESEKPVGSEGVEGGLVILQFDVEQLTQG